MSRLENLLGAQALAIVDRMAAGVGPDDASHGAGPNRGPGSSAPSEAAALVTLSAHPDRGIGWLAGVLGLTGSGATRLVERMARAGLVERRTGTDARNRTVRLTAAGSARAEAVLHNRGRALARCVEVLTPAERRNLEQLLGKVVSGLAGDRPAGLRVCRLCDRDACGGGAARLCPLEHTVPDDERAAAQATSQDRTGTTP